MDYKTLIKTQKLLSEDHHLGSKWTYAKVINCLIFTWVPKVTKFLTVLHLTTRANASPWSIPYLSSNLSAMRWVFNLLGCPSNPCLLFNYIHLLEIFFLPKGKSTRIHILFLVIDSISCDIASCHLECSFASSTMIGSNIFMTL